MSIEDCKVAVFAYNFPHKKTQDFLCRLAMEGIKNTCVLAADPVKLNIPPSTVRTKIHHYGLVHPRRIAENLGMEYIVTPHSGDSLISLLNSKNFDLGIVAGARILNEEVISRFALGIINLHPGLIPEIRGLDALLWAIHHGIPMGVTAHLIDRRVDAGRILSKEQISIFPDDTILDLSERLAEKQLDMLVPALESAVAGQYQTIDIDGPYNRKMSPEQEDAALRILPDYIRRYSSKGEK